MSSPQPRAYCSWADGSAGSTQRPVPASIDIAMMAFVNSNNALVKCILPKDCARFALNKVMRGKPVGDPIIYSQEANELCPRRAPKTKFSTL